MPKENYIQYTRTLALKTLQNFHCIPVLSIYLPVAESRVEGTLRIVLTLLHGNPGTGAYCVMAATQPTHENDSFVAAIPGTTSPLCAHHSMFTIC